MICHPSPRFHAKCCEASAVCGSRRTRRMTQPVRGNGHEARFAGSKSQMAGQLTAPCSLLLIFIRIGGLPPVSPNLQTLPRDRDDADPPLATARKERLESGRGMEERVRLTDETEMVSVVPGAFQFWGNLSHYTGRVNSGSLGASRRRSPYGDR